MSLRKKRRINQYVWFVLLSFVYEKGVSCFVACLCYVCGRWCSRSRSWISKLKGRPWVSFLHGLLNMFGLFRACCWIGPVVFVVFAMLLVGVSKFVATVWHVFRMCVWLVCIGIVGIVDGCWFNYSPIMLEMKWVDQSGLILHLKIAKHTGYTSATTTITQSTQWRIENVDMYKNLVHRTNQPKDTLGPLYRHDIPMIFLWHYFNIILIFRRWIALCYITKKTIYF